MSAAIAFSNMAANGEEFSNHNLPILTLLAGTEMSKEFIKDVFGLLSDKRTDVQSAALVMFAKLTENGMECLLLEEPFCLCIQADLFYDIIPKCNILVERLRGDDTNTKLAAATALAKIAENGKIC